MFKGNTADPTTCLNQIKKLAERFNINEVTIVGDRGMIKSGQIKQLKGAAFNYITAITKKQINTLIKKGIIQLELFEEKICEIEDNAVRYILRRNPIRAQEIETARAEKVEKVRLLVKRENEYLSEHKRAKVSVAKAKVEVVIDKFRLSEVIKLVNHQLCWCD